jgi:hypothetical protein
MCILPPDQSLASVAARLPGPARQRLALHALGGACVSRLAAEHRVSRRFVYRQAGIARRALDQAFTPPGPAARPDGDRVLFHLPVTRAWLRQLVLAPLLVNHSSYRGVVELLAELFDCPLSLGQVHGIVTSAVARAARRNAQERLGGIDVGAPDEIFQGRVPVLVGCDPYSTCCYLLRPEGRRDAATWAARLLELKGRGFAPPAPVADRGNALRGGHAQALPGVPCWDDHFHLLRDAMPVARRLDEAAYRLMERCQQLDRQQARYRWRHGRDGRPLTAKQAWARKRCDGAVALADDARVLLLWLRQDVLAVAGPDHPGRLRLYDFIVAALEARQGQAPELLGPLVAQLRAQRDGALGFAARLDRELQGLAGRFEVPVELARELLQVGALPAGSERRWRRDAALRQRLGGRYHALGAAVARLARRAARASSVTENLNSRLRNYFFLRRRVGQGYLELLRFFLNHRRFMRSEQPQREGKSPAELLSGQEHPHWLELLGYQRFRRPA